MKEIKDKQESSAQRAGCKWLVTETCTGAVCYCEERGASFECDCDDCPFREPEEVKPCRCKNTALKESRPSVQRSRA